MKLVDSEFSQTYLSVKRLFDEMMERLSQDKQFMSQLTSLQPASGPEERMKDLLTAQLKQKTAEQKQLLDELDRLEAKFADNVTRETA